MFQDSVPAGSYNDPFLSSVCVCVFVFVLFCSVVVFVFVGRQQHRRYIVIDAMVYPRNWILEGRIWYWKDLRSLCTEYCILTSGFVTEKILNLEVTTLCMNRTR